MFIFYDLIFLIAAAAYLPVYLLRGKFRRILLSRLGFFPKNLSLNDPIWVHAVSVGEAIAIKGLVEELRKAYPGKKFVISTVTATGNKIARGIAQEGDLLAYLPLDLSFIVKGAINRVNPCLFILAETEIWPNLISCLHKKKIPVITVNGRISDRSFKGYLGIKFLLQGILQKVSFFCVQAERDAQRLLRLGVEPEKIKATGNMKFDIGDYADLKKDCTDYKKRMGLGLQDKLLVAGSTHRPEEEIILTIYRELLERFPYLRLLIAPRHPERSNDIARIALRLGFTSILVSALPPRGFEDSAKPVFILDTVGQLLYYYAAGDIVFVGGSLVKKGGHNILEPASLDKPIIFGPHM